MGTTISEDDFVDVWGASASDTGDLFEHPSVKDLPLNTVWTVVETDDGHWIAIPGFHIVNKLGYVVTTKLWDDETIGAYWCKFDEDMDQYHDIDGD